MSTRPEDILGLDQTGAVAQLTNRIGRSDIAPIRRNLLEQAYAEFGNLVSKAAAAVRPDPNQKYGLGFAEAARYGIDKGREFVADWWDRGASGFEDSSNKLPMVRAPSGLMSMQVDPRLLDMVDVATLGSMGLTRVARGTIQGSEQAIREFLEAGVRSGGQVVAGGRSKTANLAARDTAMGLAERMPESPAKRDMIHRATGWWQGKDGQWRYEISDEEAKLSPELVKAGSWTGRLGDIFEHAKLFEAYPHLRDTQVELLIDPTKPRGGHFDGARNIIVMRAPSAEAMRKGIVHEVGHGIQYEEGFAPGGTPESAQERIRRTLENDPYLPEKDQLTLDQAAKMAALHDDPVRAYRHLAGETEARVGEQRINMTEAYRRARPPYKDFDVPEQDQLVLTGLRDKPVAMSYSGGGDMRVNGSDTGLSAIARDFMREKGLVDPAEASSQQLARVNIGLKRGRDGADYSHEEAIAALREMGIDVKRFRVVRDEGDTEDTLIAELSRPATPDEMERLSVKLGQEAIPQKVGDAGELYGPKAAEWGGYQDNFFKDVSRFDEPLSNKDIAKMAGSEEDIARSLIQAAGAKKAAKAEPIGLDDVMTAIRNRERYRSEPAVTPGPKASDQEWADWGAKHGVNLTVTKPVQVADGISVPGGTEGTFTIPDLFWIKANNFDPKRLPRDVHDALMRKLIRTYAPNGAVDDATIMRALNFTQLSPNTPLLQNEFMSQRLRQAPGESLADLASSRRDAAAQPGGVSVATGIQSAARGGMGLRGTADPEWMTTTAEILDKYPELFRTREGETLHDVAQRLSSFLPGIGQKTSSLGVPFFDLTKGNTSAVDLHMIRNNWQRLLSDEKVGAEFRAALAKRLKIEDDSPEAIKAAVEEKGKQGFLAVRGVIESQPSAQYRTKKGDYNARVPAPQRDLPAELEPKKTKIFNPFYNRIVDYVNESASSTGALPLFGEQWRLWDTYRGRFEPHEFAHPDWEKLPKQSWSEMQAALKENRKAGFARKEGLPPGGYKGDWKKLYYGMADTDLLAFIAAGTATGATLFPLLSDDEKK